MINLLRNREVRRHLVFLAAVGAAGAILTFLLGGASSGVVFLAAGTATIVSTCRFSKSRYGEIARLSDCLSRIAAGDYQVDLREYGEGELSILYDELHKVTRTLSHQAERLRRDKRWLADTMADVSHQLKTPLTAISLQVELLQEPELPPEKRKEFLDGLRSGIERIRWLSLSLLKLSRLDAGAVTFRRGRIAVAELAKRALEPLGVLMELKGQKLLLEIHPEAELDCDPDWMVEALGNLLKNGVEHTGPGGTIGIRLRENPLYTLIEIRDNGPGIPADELPHIFERFFRGQRAAADSVGIGLALSKSVIHQHGGVIEARSVPGEGTTFSVKFYSTAV